MSRLADPALCPDCRGAVRPDATCSSCGLVLRGPLADRLWQTMLVADGLVEQIRTTPAAAPVPFPVDRRPQAPAAPRVPGRTVPALLLTLGGLLVFVAVSLFLAVTWTVLPLAFKALIMAGFTVAVSAGAYLLSRRSLRGSAEAIWGLAGAVLALDLSAAHRAGLFGLDGISDRSMTIVGGLVVAGFGLGAALVVRRTPLRHSRLAELVLALGIFAVSAAAFWTGSTSAGGGQALGVVLLAGAAWGLHRLGTRLAAAGVAVVMVLTWLDLAAVGGVDGLDAASRSAFWHGFDGWPLLVAAVLAALPACIARLPREARVGCALASLVSASLLAVLPLGLGTLDLLAGSAVLVVFAGLAVAPVGSVWTLAARCLAGVGTAAGGVGLVAISLVVPIGYAIDHDRWSLPVGLAFDDGLDGLRTAPWTLLAVLTATALGALAVAPARSTQLMLLPAASAVTMAGVLGLAAAPVWSVGAALAVAAVLAAAPMVRSATLAGPMGTGTGMGLAWVSVAVLSRTDLLAPRPGSLVVTALACALLLAAGRVARRTDTRVAVEVGAAGTGVLAVLTTPSGYSPLAMTLTLLGSAVALLSVLRADRAVLGWVGSAVLTLGTFVRLGDPGPVATELYAMPAAAVLLAVGVRRLLREPDLATWRVLGAGLSLALLPSLVLALGDPGSLRTALVVVGAGIAVGVGLERRWQAPFLYGLATAAVLALRFLLPLAADVLANPLGAWLLFGAAGAACLTAGVLWEHSLRNLRTASRFVGSLR